MLIDAGVGPFSTAGLSGGALLDELAALGVEPADIDVIAVSHLHLDHDGWLVTKRRGCHVPQRGRALGRRDYEYFVVDDASNDFRMARHKTAGFAELFDAGRVVLVDDATEIVPGVVALPTPGHTPAISRSRSATTTSRSLILGDTMYCPAQLTDCRPDRDARHRSRAGTTEPRR